MNEKKSLARWLRSAEVYEDPAFRQPGDDWRESLLAEYEKPAPPVLAPGRREVARGPLQWHHLVQLAPAGVGLFLAGFMVGSGDRLATRLAGVHPFVWMGLAMTVGLSALVWLRRQNA